MSLRRGLASWAFVSVALVAGCGGSSPESDASTDVSAPDAAGACRTDEGCDDGLFCDGTERCSDGRCAPGPATRCDDGVACTVDSCSESLRACVAHVPDEDGDGLGTASCLDAAGAPLGTDCDDADAARFPGNLEVCDAAAHDEDCDPHTHGGTDADSDGFEDARCCNGTDCGDDCDDGHASAHPGASEVCNLVDDDCDTRVDESAASPGFVDADRDGYGDPAMPITACASAAGFSADGTDCDDANAARSPGQVEFCDGIDNDCDPRVDESASAVPWYLDQDHDGFGSRASATSACIPPAGYALRGTDCDDAAAAISPAAVELCNGVDDDCNGTADFVIALGDLEDDDRDGRADARCGAPLGVDCDDRDATSGPGSAEACDGRDNDCDGRVDEGAVQTAFYRDLDGDGYGDTRSVRVGCTPPTGFARRGGDCDDGDDAVFPSAIEQCGDAPGPVDQDCDGATDEAPAAASCTEIPGSTMSCVANACAPTGCAPGYGDCASAPGCETDIASSPDHCGSCAPCALPLSACSAGTCGPTFSWVSALPADVGDVRVERVLALPGSTDVVVAGAFTGSLTLGATTLVSAGAHDGFAARIRADLTLAWSAQWGGAGDDAIHAVATSPDGSAFVVGGELCDATLCGGPISGCYGFWQRFDSAAMPGCIYADGIVASTASIEALALEQTGGQTYVYGAGTFGGTGSHGAGASTGGLDGFVFRAVEVPGSQPTYEWLRTFGGMYDEVPADLALEGSSSLVVVGATSSSADFGHGPTGHAGFDDAFAVHLARATGAVGLAGQFGTSSGYDRATRVVALPGGRVAIAGVFSSGMLVLGGTTLTGAGPASVFVFSMAGGTLTPAWGVALDGDADVGGLDVLGGQILLGGAFQSALSFDRGTLTTSGTGAFVAELAGLGGTTVFARATAGPARTGGVAALSSGSVVWEIDRSGALALPGLPTLPARTDADPAIVLLTP